MVGVCPAPLDDCGVVEPELVACASEPLVPFAAADAKSASSCALVTHVSPESSLTHSLFVLTSPANNSAIPFSALANQLRSLPNKEVKNLPAYESLS